MTRILIAGFGGQGILFTGKLLAYAGMLTGRQVTWIPSYGPEMRGGTTNCGVILSDTLIGSPVVLTPDIFLCFNAPSLDKFESKLADGGVAFIDNSLAKRPAAAGVRAFYLPAGALAYENGLEGLANMVMLGKVLKECALCDRDTAEAAMKKCVSERRQDKIALNMKALALGFAYESEEGAYVDQP